MHNFYSKYFIKLGKKPGWTGNIHTQLLSAVRKEYRGRSI
jgi:hypothetical protein